MQSNEATQKTPLLAAGSFDAHYKDVGGLDDTLSKKVQQDINVITLKLKESLGSLEGSNDYDACVKELKKFRSTIDNQIVHLEKRRDQERDLKELEAREESESSEEQQFWTKGKIFICLSLFYVLFGNFWFIWRYSYSFIDSMFTIVVIFTTVGYGIEIVESEFDQFVIILYVIFGVGIIASGGASVVMDFVSDHQQKKQRFLQRDDDEETMYSTNVNRDVSSIQGCMNVFFEYLEMGSVQIILWLGFTLGGAFLIGWFEEWHWFESVYFAVMSGSTVGFGDYTPSHFWGKFLLIFYLPVLVASTGYAFAVVFSKAIYSVVDEEREAHLKFKTEAKSLLNTGNFYTNLELFDKDGDGKVSEDEFLLVVLMNHHNTPIEMIQAAREQYRKLDKDGDGEVTLADFIDQL